MKEANKGNEPYTETAANLEERNPQNRTLRERFGRLAQNMLEWLGTIGLQPDGGVTRLLYSPSWREAQQALLEQMARIGLQTYQDAVGNVFGRLQGSEQKGCILTGSHIDTVKNGGKYDGAYGIVAGVIALSFLKEHYGQPRRTIEVVSLCEEEGSRFPLTYWGSGNITGIYSVERDGMACDDEGISLRQAMEQSGEFARMGRRPFRDDIAAFVELHVEQGGVLEHWQRTIGIVEGIAAQKRIAVHVEGEANHAGTTPMYLRRDALAGAAAMIQAAIRCARDAGHPLVATVGRMHVKPNAVNVIPGQVMFTLDIRHPDGGQLDRFYASCLEMFHKIAVEHGLQVKTEVWMDAPSIGMDLRLKEMVKEICDAKGISHMRMFSGAGHDAGVFASRCAASLIFVPSQKGISHSPLEFTAAEELGAGIEVLVELLYRLAYLEEEIQLY